MLEDKDFPLINMNRYEGDRRYGSLYLLQQKPNVVYKLKMVETRLPPGSVWLNRQANDEPLEPEFSMC